MRRHAATVLLLSALLLGPALLPPAHAAAEGEPSALAFHHRAPLALAHRARVSPKDETAVELGARNGTDVEVRSGLAEGDQVARNGAATSAAGEAG